MRWITDREGRLVWVSDEWEQFTGVGVADLEGKTGEWVIHESERARILVAGMRSVFALQEFDCHFHHFSHGRFVPVVVHCRPILENGIWRGYYGATQPLGLQPIDQSSRILKPFPLRT